MTIRPPGHGNWADVSRYVASPNKGPAECREAVNNFFVSSAIGTPGKTEEVETGNILRSQAWQHGERTREEMPKTTQVLLNRALEQPLAPQALLKS